MIGHDLRRYAAILWHWAWLLLLAAVLSGGAAYALSVRQAPTYEAATTVLIEEAAGQKAGDYTSILASERRARTYAEIMKTDELLSAVHQRLELSLSLERLKEAVNVSMVRDTQLIKVTVRDSDPQRAALMANTLVKVFAEQTSAIQASRYAASKENLAQQLESLDAQIEETEAELQRTRDSGEREQLQSLLAQYRASHANLTQSFEEVRVAEAQSSSTIIPVQQAEAPTRPVAPRVLLNTLLAAIVGLLVAIGLVFLREALDDTVKDPDELGQRLELPILGLIARIKGSDHRALVTVDAPRAPVSEAFRSLRTNIQFSSVDRPLRTILVTSPAPAEGKSTVVSNLGVVLAQGGYRVALIDADLRRPRLHRVLGIANRSGLTDLFIQKRLHLNGHVRRTVIDDVAVLPAGGIPPNPAELLSSSKMSEILRLAREQADFVLLDTPPALPVTDAVALAQQVDGVLLVVKAGKTRLPQAEQAVEQLRRVGANLIGVVINDIPVGRSSYAYAYHHYYAHYYGERRSDAGLRRLFGRRRRARPAERDVDVQV